MKLRPLKHSKGFTLVEIMVVIAILALLGATTMYVMSSMDEKKLTTAAKTQVGALTLALDAYMADGYRLEDGYGDDGSSNALYRMISGDKNNDGEPDRIGSGRDAKPARVYCSELVILRNSKDVVADGIPVVRAEARIRTGRKSVRKKCLLIVDPWGNPYRYCLGFEQKDSEGRHGTGNNPTYDIFSQGPDAKGDGKNNVGDNADNITNVPGW